MGTRRSRGDINAENDKQDEWENFSKNEFRRGKEERKEDIEKVEPVFRAWLAASLRSKSDENARGEKMWWKSEQIDKRGKQKDHSREIEEKKEEINKSERTEKGSRARFA